jgi:glucosamine-6-phosphate deaminase
MPSGCQNPSSPSPDTLGLRLAEAIRDQLAVQPASCLGLPTGRTPLVAYRLLAEWSSQGLVDWRQVQCFALDEYLETLSAWSFQTYLEENLYRHTNLPEHSRHSPLAIVNYDEVIAEHGGLDLTIVGIGRNGHIAFNEPGTPLASWTHVAWLSDSTRQANSEFFPSPQQVPTRALTMGIRTILNSRHIILVAGASKAAVLQEALAGPVTSNLPASFLQLHEHLSVLTD